MPLNTFASQDEIPEALRESALALADGKFAVYEPEDTTALQQAIQAERTKREAAEKAAAKAAAELKKRETAGKATDAGITGEKLKEIEAEIAAAKESEYAPKLAEADKYKAKVRELLLVNHIKALASEVGKIMAPHQQDFWKLYGDEFDLTEDETVIVKSAPGKPVQKHIEELAKRQPAWVEGTKATGGNAQGDGGAKMHAGTLTVADVLKNPAAAMNIGRAKAA